MAKLYISEFAMKGAAGSGAPVEIAQEPCLSDQSPLEFSSGAQLSSAFLPGTRFIRVHTDATCSIAIGSAPTATVSNKRLFANTTEYFGVVPGDRLAVVMNT